MTDPSPDMLWREAQRAFRPDPARAAALCERLLARTPGFWGAHWMLARIFQARHQFRAAVAHARASARSLPSNATPHEILLVSSGLISAGEYGTCAQLLAALPRDVRLDPMQFAGVAEQWMMLDDPAAALQWTKGARDAGIRGSALSLLRGNAHKFLGQLGESLAAYEDAIALDPRNAHAHLALASLDIETDRAARIARLERVVATAGVGDPSRAVLGYALFKELDHADDPERAWPHLAAAMALRKAASRYDASREDAIFDRIIQAARVDDVVEDPDEARVPIFIIGLPRSGTTLVERILGNHPDVASCGELNELRMAYKWASDYYCEGFLDEEAARRLANTDAKTVGTLYTGATHWRVGQRRWHTDKHPGNLVLAGLALAALPTARIVHVRKDPMDACFGCLREMFAAAFYDYSHAFEDVANHHRNYSRLMRHLRDIAPDRIVDVQYEVLVADADTSAQAILAGCGLTPRTGVEDVTANRQRVTTASSVQVRSPIHAGRVGYWKRYARQLAPLHALLETNADG